MKERRATSRPADVSILYDAPGPRARQITTVASIITGVIVLGVAYVLVYRPLAANGQFTMAKWGPLIGPGNEYFGQVWTRIGHGIIATLSAAAAAIVTSLICGTILAVLRLQLRTLSNRRYRHLPRLAALSVRGATAGLNGATRLAIEVFRGIPVIITIFFSWRLLGGTGVGPLVVGLTIYNMIVIAEIIRSGMEGLPPGQREAAASAGLSSLQTTWYVLLPQAFRIMLPALISQLVVILKDTSLGFIISYEETVRVGGQLTEALGALDPDYRNPIQMYAVIGAMFVIVNYTLSKLAQFTERRLAGRVRA